jgi:predicted nucleic acid-binding protein
LTWSIVYEFLRVATHPRVFRQPLSISQAWSFIEALLLSQSVGLLTESDNHAALAAELIADMPELRGNLVFDARTAVLMREHGVRTICTRDTDFNRFPFLEVVDPVSRARGQS